MRSACLLLVALLAACVPPAHAQVRTIELPGYGTAGPRLGGDGVVVWSQLVGRDTVAFAEGPSGRVELDRQFAYDSPIGSARSSALETDAGEVALLTWTTGCPGDEQCKYSAPHPYGHRLLAGPASGPLAPVATPCEATRVAAGGGAVACDGQAGPHVTEADGTVRHYEAAFLEGHPNVRLAGDLVALRTELERGTGVRVLRRTTGEELVRVRVAVGPFDLGADGTVAYLLPDGRAGWSSPGDPAVHVLPAGPATGVVLAGDRVALRSLDGRFSRFEIVGLDGVVYASHDTNAAVGGFDYDGRRLVYARRPCTTGELRVWDTEAPPGPQELLLAGCTLPAASVKRRARAPRRLHVTVRCEPRDAAAGCAATVLATLRWRDRRGRRRRNALPLVRPVLMELGETERFAVRLPRRVSRRARSASAVIVVHGRDGDRERTVTPLRLR